ncbi:MAG: HIT domain-containing protein [Parcubacteria group bacterium]|nr:HIT domain-containing protein [Parcubacteria group bacterium]
MTECLFCNIAAKKVSAQVEYEDQSFIAFQDLYPKAQVHLLLIPKKHIHSVDHLKEEDKELMGSLILTAQKIAKQNRLDGYKLHFNVGRSGGQVVDHLHLHILSGTINHEV